MKAWRPLSLVFLALAIPELVLSAALSGPIHRELTEARSVDLDYLCLVAPDLLSFPLSLLPSTSRNNASCWSISLSGSPWDNPPGSALDDSELDIVGRSSARQPNKRDTDSLSSTTQILASRTVPPNMSPTPEPTGSSSPLTTVHITSEEDFALLLPNHPGELVSDAESDGVAFCTPGSTDASCSGRLMQRGFVRAAAIERAGDGAWIQVTGCLDPSKSSLDPADDGGQFDVRFPQGAQCAFGGFGASFIEQCLSA
ncbi:hypothetical protein EIP86_002741 [Pleurotus ostreatoroseus]|nr:hypothetical protein EIP86_002741 [Pleurotus ostreatoroseus]